MDFFIFAILDTIYKDFGEVEENQLFGQNLSLEEKPVEVVGGGQARWQVGSLPGAFSEKAFQHCWRQN